MVDRKAVIHVPAIVKAAAIAEAMLSDDGARPVHEGGGKPPSALIEVACGASVMARVGNVAAMRETAYMPRLVACRNEVGDQPLKAGGKMACNRDRPSRCRNRHHAAPPAHSGAVILREPRMQFPSPAGLSRAMARVVCGVGVMRGAGMVMFGVVMVMVVMPVSGLCRDRSGQKNGGRCE